MTEPERFDTALPPDLAEVERLLRAPAAAPPPELLERIHASRDLGVVVERMLLAEEEFTARTRRSRTMVGIAAAAVLMLGAYATWPLVSTPRERTTPPSVLTPSGPTPVDLSGIRPPKVDGLSRLLIPWPSVAGAQLPTTLDRRYPRGSTLTPQFKSNVYNERRTFVRTVMAPDGRQVESSRVEWELANIRWNDKRYAPTVIARRYADSSAVANECDTLVMGSKLDLWQRRLHRSGYERYFLFDEAFRWVQVADSASLLRYRNSPEMSPAPGTQLWKGVPAQYFRKLSGRHSLVVSEAHLALLLRTVPLWSGWEVTVAIPTTYTAIAPKYDAGIMNLRVTGIDTLATRVGSFRAYKLQLDYGAGTDFWWVDSHTGGVLQTMRPLINGYWEVNRIGAVERPRLVAP